MKKRNLNTNKLVRFFFIKKGFALRDRKKLRFFVELIFKKERKKLQDLSYIFCSDDYLLSINQQYLKHDYYTDIISFGFTRPPKPITGEIYISIDRVRENAWHFNNSQKKELHRVIFHGALHLCGYKDKTPKDKEKMKSLEDKYLDLYFRI